MMFPSTRVLGKGACPRVFAWLAALLLALIATQAWAHPAPFSYMDLDLQDGGIDGTLTVHVIDIAHEMQADDTDHLLEPQGLKEAAPHITKLLGSRLGLRSKEGSALPVTWTGVEAHADNDAIRLTFRLDGTPPGALDIRPQLFPYDPQHQTFVNIYESGDLAQQWIIAKGDDPRTYYAGSSAGVWEVVKVFVPSGIHHIMIGPDHILFLFGLILLGGSLGQLVRIITAFTLGHTVTLALATLDIVTVPSTLVEPAIALSIVVVGADNLLRDEGRDVRSWVALAFGLIHGFGFASVLKEFGLPQEALGWSLFSFNVGVELGQLALVVPAALLLAAIRRYSPVLRKRVTVTGSIIVIGAGTWWFIQRVFL